MTAREPLPLEPVSNEKLRELECNALDEPALLHLFNWHDLAAVVLELAELRRRPPSAREEEMRAALIEMRERDDRNGSLPTWYRERIECALGKQ